MAIVQTQRHLHRLDGVPHRMAHIQKGAAGSALKGVCGDHLELDLGRIADPKGRMGPRTTGYFSP